MIPLEIIQGSRPGPIRASQGYRRDSARVSYKPSQDPTGSLPGTVGVGVLPFKICPRVPGGSRQGPRRASAGQKLTLS